MLPLFLVDYCFVLFFKFLALGPVGPFLKTVVSSTPVIPYLPSSKKSCNLGGGTLLYQRVPLFCVVIEFKNISHFCINLL